MTRLSAPSREEYGSILANFLDDIGFSMPAREPDMSIIRPVVSHFESQPWAPSLIKKAVHKAELTAGMEVVYPFVSWDTKVMYGIFCTYMFLIDDSDEELDAELEDFESNLIKGRPQKSPFLRSMMTFIDGMDSCFGPYSRTMISKSMVEFASGRRIETCYNGVMRPTVGALNFPYYLRQKAGIAEPVAHFVFPQSLYPEEKCLSTFILILPDVCDLVSFVNDVMSFYKESILSDETINYVWNLATVHDVSISEALRHTCARAIRSVNNIRTVLLFQDPQMLDTTDQFIQGYIAWYLKQARYRLSDIEIRKKC